jgi:FdhD/NarQ family protein
VTDLATSGSADRLCPEVRDDRRSSLPPPAQQFPCASWGSRVLAGGERTVPEEIPVAFTYNGSSYAVMMATPADLEDLAVGFSLTEGIIGTPAQIESFEAIPVGDGIELRMWIARAAYDALQQWQRRLAGPTGCGLCGIESIADALRPVRTVQSSLIVAASLIGDVASASNLPLRWELKYRIRRWPEILVGASAGECRAVSARPGYVFS